MFYNILKSNLFPAYDKRGERERVDNQGAWRVEWEIVGKATSIDDAKRQGFFAPVLEEINVLH